jgi:circadian clock protein KaiC
MDDEQGMDGGPVASGLAALDYVLDGGYARNRVHLLEGKPGSGKTTLALQFLIEGQRQGESCLYITLSESRVELLNVAGTHGFDMQGIDIFELVPPELSLDAEREQSVLYLSDLELGETVALVREAVEKASPSRVVFDSLSEIRMLSQNILRYRRQVLALKHFFTQRGCTVIFLDDVTNEEDDLNLHSLAHGVIRMEQNPTGYGKARRRLRVFKMRGRDFRSGYHDFTIKRGGIALFPRLIAAEHALFPEDDAPVPSGVEALDRIVGGGLDRGTTTLVIGPSGAGKSTLCMQYFKSALDRGEKGIFISFDETRRNFTRRGKGLGIDFEEDMEAGRFVFRQVDPAELSSGELADMIRSHIDAGFRMLAIDSLSGYQHALPEESYLILQMHELLTYLNQQGVVTFLVIAQSGIIGNMNSPVDLTYLSDTVLLLRFFEAEGRLRRALSVVKKRTGEHETSIRELVIRPDGLRLGEPLVGFRGVMTGTPTFQDMS